MGRLTSYTQIYLFIYLLIIIYYLFYLFLAGGHEASLYIKGNQIP